MKLVRFGPRGGEKPGVVAPSGRIKDISAHVTDYDHRFFASGGLEAVRGLAARIDDLPDAPAEARASVAGFAIGNDVSERSFQLERGGQWSKGKSSDNFFPLGPWLVTPDEVGDPQSLTLTLDVNGVRKQLGHTSSMIFDVWHVVWYVSQFLTLEAGDVITTGTPPGVGMARKPPEFLKSGDVVELAIDGLGRQRCECVQA